MIPCVDEDGKDKIFAETGFNGRPPAAKSIKPTADGYLLIDKASFPMDFAADLPAAQAKFIALSQVPWNGKIVETPIAMPAWKHKPAYGFVATQDRMTNPDLKCAMYAHAKASVTEVKGSHVIFIS